MKLTFHTFRTYQTTNTQGTTNIQLEWVSDAHMRATTKAQAQVLLTKPWWSQLKSECYAQSQQVFVLQYPSSIVRMQKNNDNSKYVRSNPTT